jgi:hypothetical protein
MLNFPNLIDFIEDIGETCKIMSDDSGNWVLKQFEHGWDDAIIVSLLKLGIHLIAEHSNEMQTRISHFWIRAIKVHNC